MVRPSKQPISIEQTHYRSQLMGAFRSLRATPCKADLSRWAALLESVSGSEGRLFHNGEHILQLCEGGDGLNTLAALFHDAVYVQVDGGLAPLAQDYLQPFLICKDGTLYVRSQEELQQRRGSALVAFIFGFEHQTPQPASQHNELLSALLAVECLQKDLDWAELAQIVAAIEATIPFRPLEQGRSRVDGLFERLSLSNECFQLGLSPSSLARAMHRAVALANRDVSGFALQDPTVFLAHTWRLLPELNPALRSPQRYSVQDYRKAIVHMEQFLLALDPDTVFQQFRHFPDDATYQSWQRRARHNVSVARLYLRTKIVAIALLEALSPYRSEAGAQMPLADWIRPQQGESPWEESFGQWSISHPMTNIAQCHALQVAEAGRDGNCSFDLSQSPLSAFLIRTLGFERIEQLRRQANDLFEQRLPPEQFLALCEARVVTPLSQRLMTQA